MKIIVIGASAGVGLLTVQQALAKGHAVTALARNTESLANHVRLTKINGSATSAADVRRALTGADAVIITIGSQNKKASTLYTDTAKAVIAAATDINLAAPVLAITGFGVGDSSAYLNLPMALVVKGLLREQTKDKAQLEALFAQSQLKWEMVRPGILSDGPLTKAYQVLPKLHRGIKVWKISRADVADFLLREAENPTLLYQRPAITA